MLNFPALRIFLLSLAITSTSLSMGAVVDQQILAPQTLTAPLSGQITKSYSFAATSSAGKLTLINGDGTDLTPQICSGNIVQKLSCQLNNTVKQLKVVLTRPKSVEVKLNNQNALNAIAWNPAVGNCAVRSPRL